MGCFTHLFQIFFLPLILSLQVIALGLNKDLEHQMLFVLLFGKQQKKQLKTENSLKSWHIHHSEQMLINNFYIIYINIYLYI